MRPTDLLKNMAPPPKIPTSPQAPTAPPVPDDPRAVRELPEPVAGEREPCSSCELMARSTPFGMSAYCAWEYRALPRGHANRRFIGVLGALSFGVGVWFNLSYHFEPMEERHRK